ncbi:hypothetical protein [Salibacterium halotolerans]|uniref:hypothetical protein n=1 Tax=Salibacterium halotolerans TaxID=1884432 RepID=UPI000B821258|nr:hypothetical protein [Salibacterium halotolerans]
MQSVVSGGELTGTYHAGVTKDGFYTFTTAEPIDAEALEWIRVYADAPFVSESGTPVGESVDTEITFE